MLLYVVVSVSYVLGLVIYDVDIAVVIPEIFSCSNATNMVLDEPEPYTRRSYGHCVHYFSINQIE